MKPFIYLDFETQSAVNLRTVGTKQYIEHESTRIMSAVFMTEDEKLTVWLPPSVMPPGMKPTPIPGVKFRYDRHLPVEYFNDYTPVAHNAEHFDRRVAERFGHMASGIIWEDTITLARAAGYPASLDGLLKAFGYPGKGDDTAMKVLTNAKISGGRYVYMTGTRPLWDKLIKYNIEDVKQLKALHDGLRVHNNLDPDFYAQHIAMNDRGFRIDKRRLMQLVTAWEDCTEAAGDEIQRITDGELNAESVRSPAKVKAWLIGKGFWLPGNSLSKQNLVDVFAHPERYTTGMDEHDGLAVLALLAERQNAVSAVAGKLKRIRDEMTDSDHVTHTLVIHGAHTGRDSGKVVQPQNFPRGCAIPKETYEVLVTAKDWSFTNAEKCATALNDSTIRPRDVLSTLTRNIIVPSEKGNTFVIADYGQVEARVLAWLAGCGKMLKTFADPAADIYQEMASKLGAGRFMGKQVILACGYQMWVDKFEVTCKSFGIDLKKLGLTPRQCVMAYRDAYPEIPALWKAYQTAAWDAVQTGREQHAGRCCFSYGAGWLVIELPSGRTLRYRDAAIEVFRDREQVCYSNGYNIRRGLYGGLITENIDQGISNDLLRDTVVKIAAGVGMSGKELRTRTLRMRVHDELVYEVERGVAKDLLKGITRVMSKGAEWSEGLPVMVEAFTADRYTKNKFVHSIQACYLGGKKVK